ncbi:PUT1 [Symbiodinium sp. CCMP2592]|nr:PUT1 [Symbiodinium sp. CCMP2592]
MAFSISSLSPTTKRDSGAFFVAYGFAVAQWTSLSLKLSCTPAMPSFPETRQRLSLLGLVAIIYYSVSGGPYGVEDAVSSAGPLLSLTGFLVMPLVWSVPEALVTAELATCFPSNAGFVEWVTAAFGPFWGFVEGFLSWLSAVADASLYPVLFRDYLVTVWPEIGSGVAGHIFIAVPTLAITALNYVGLSIVGWVAFALAGFVLSPFAFMVVVGAPKIEPSKLLISPPASEVDWSGFLNVLFWNLNYWDSASTLAGEVQDVERSYPKALGLALIAVVLSYLLPLLIGLGIPGPTADWKNWQSGELAVVGGQLGGPFVKSWVIAGAAVSCLAQQLSEMAEGAFQLQGMAEDGWLPSFFGHRSRYDTPSVGLLLIAILVLVLSSSSSFSAIVNVLNAVYCIAQVLEFSAFLHLRRRHNDMERPFRVPCSFQVCCLMLALPLAFCFVLLILPFFAGDWLQVGAIGGSVAMAVLLHCCLEFCRRHGWLHFRRQPPRGLEDILAAQASHFASTASESPQHGSETFGQSDLQMLSQTLTSLAQAHGAHSFHVVLAMEAREGPAGLEKAAQLDRGFSKYFSTFRSTSHPSNLREEHADGSWDPEVPGKASNVKWAVREAHRELLKESVDPASVILTVADADVVFHPRYFSHLTRDFGTVRRRGGGWHEWTIWQAPQLPFRNYYASPACSRVWAYVASIWECGGVAGLSFGSEHFAFSTYSLPLLLAVEAEAHEGDVIAEDHHCYIRCFFYSAVKEAALAQGGQEIPTWRGLARAHLRPIFLPVKSTSVVSDKGVWQTWIDRWFQAKRHAQGVAELSFFAPRLQPRTYAASPAKMQEKMRRNDPKLYLRLCLQQMFGPSAVFFVSGVNPN